MAVSHHKCTVVTPCYNEAARLKGDDFIKFVECHEAIRFLFVNAGIRSTACIESRFPPPIIACRRGWRVALAPLPSGSLRGAGIAHAISSEYGWTG